MKDFWANLADFGANRALNEVEIYMNHKGIEYRTIDKSRSARIYAELKAHIAPPKRVIQVLGTNGKGSTGRFIAQILAQNGFKILHFTSPHIFSFNERFYTNDGQNLGIVRDSALINAHRFLQKFAFVNECSYFEYATFLALVLAQGVDFAILEAGVGGELDSTSVVSRDLCVFSVIDYDHTDILGDSIEAIATTKLNAVFYPNLVPKMVLGGQKYAIVEKIAESIAKKHGVEIFKVDCHDLQNKSRNDENSARHFCYIERSEISQNRDFSPTAQSVGFASEAKQPNDNIKNAESVSNTHPLTPSAREGESIDSSLRDARSEASATKQSKSRESKKISESRIEKRINADSLQVRDLANAQSLHNRLPRESCGFSRNDEIWANCHDFTQGVESRNDEVGTDCHDLQNKSRNDEVVADSHNLDSSLDSLAHNDKIHIESYLQKHRLAPFLAQNLALALKAVQIFGTDLPIKIDLDSLPKLDLHGRFEQITPNITIDVGHNQNAALAIKKQLNDKKIILVYNSYFQKNISEILSILKDNILRVEILSVADNPRIIEQSKLEKILDSLQIAHTHFKGVDSLDSAQNYLIFGSFSVVEAFMRDFMNGAK